MICRWNSVTGWRPAYALQVDALADVVDERQVIAPAAVQQHQGQLALGLAQFVRAHLAGQLRVVLGRPILADGDVVAPAQQASRWCAIIWRCSSTIAEYRHSVLRISKFCPSITRWARAIASPPRGRPPGRAAVRDDGRAGRDRARRSA